MERLAQNNTHFSYEVDLRTVEPYTVTSAVPQRNGEHIPMMPLRCVFDIPAHPIQMALGKQELLFKKLLQGDTTNHIIFAEHRPVYTYDHGKVRNNDFRGLIRGAPDITLPAPLIPVSRGGGITYHGPGQLVCYFVFTVKKIDGGVLGMNELIEKSIKKLLARYGLFGAPKPRELPEEANGVWVSDTGGTSRKIASRGLSVRNGITRFGCALNVTTDLAGFAPIFPCGLDIHMTSIEKEAGLILDMRDTAHALSSIVTEQLGGY